MDTRNNEAFVFNINLNANEFSQLLKNSTTTPIEPLPILYHLGELPDLSFSNEAEQPPIVETKKRPLSPSDIAQVSDQEPLRKHKKNNLAATPSDDEYVGGSSSSDSSETKNEKNVTLVKSVVKKNNLDNSLNKNNLSATSTNKIQQTLNMNVSSNKNMTYSNFRILKKGEREKIWPTLTPAVQNQLKKEKMEHTRKVNKEYAQLNRDRKKGRITDAKKNIEELEAELNNTNIKIKKLKDEKNALKNEYQTLLQLFKQRFYPALLKDPQKSEFQQNTQTPTIKK